MNILSLSRAFRHMGLDDKLWRMLISRMMWEHGVYVPSVITGAGSWKCLFLELYRRRNLWVARGVDDASDQSQYDHRFKISVFARFRPEPETKRSEGDDDDTTEGGQAVVLPLHQRLRMIQMSGKARSNREALRVLATDGEWFQKKWTGLLETRSAAPTISLGVENSAPENPKPAHFLLHEDQNFLRKNEHPLDFVKKAPEKVIARVQSVDSGLGRVIMVAPDVGLREFAFDGVLPVKASQASVYDNTARRLVVDFLNGFNATLLAYGQTGSGKTFTMFGGEEGSALLGIVPRACRETLEAINHPSRLKMGIVSTLTMTYVEVYGELVTDLLQNGSRCGHSKVASQRYVLSGAAERPVSTINDVHEALRVGDATKRRAATAMNDRSSRAHSILILSLYQKCSTGVEATSRLFLADLGGSEDVQKSKIEAGQSKFGLEEQFSVGFTKAENMREAVNINLGLLALKKVVEALNTQSQYIPYQDSKLTMILSQGLGGNSKTSIITTASMSPAHAAETVSTLRFGEKCSLIENDTRTNANMLASVLLDLDARIAALEAEIKVKERWVVDEEVRMDSLAETNTVEAAVGGREVKKVATLIGAEAERKQLEELLVRRAAFTGIDLGGRSLVVEGDDAMASTLRRRKKVVGFGAKSFFYGLGEAYDQDEDLNQGNERFSAAVDEELLPAVVKAKGGRQWTKPEDLEEAPEMLEARAKKVNRSKLVYSGISA